MSGHRSLVATLSVAEMVSKNFTGEHLMAW
jgi:hypothetical protein